MTREMLRMLSGRSMESHSMVEVVFVWNMQMEMMREVITQVIAEVTVKDGEAVIDVEIETGILVDVADKYSIC